MISVPYDGTIREFDLHYRNLWEWATDLLRDPQLFPHMVFDAQCFSKFDGKTFVTFVDEPYMAEAFWNVQVCNTVVVMSCIRELIYSFTS
jgi:hypothetical protein